MRTRGDSNGRGRIRLAASFAIVLSALGLPGLSAAAGSIAEYLDGVEPGVSPGLAGHRLLAIDILEPFYETRNDTPAWNDERQWRALLELIADAESHGLRPEDLLQSTLSALAEDPDRNAVVFDLLLSEALVRYAYNRVFGKLNPVTVDRDINFRRSLRRDAPPHETMAFLLGEPDLSEALETLAAHGPWYRAMRSKLLQIRAVEAAGGWPQVSEGPTLHPGDRSERIVQLRRRLAAQPALDVEATSDPTRFDEALASAVRQFQRIHGLDVDGIVGPGTLRSLNVPVAVRIDQLTLSLERLRWVSGDVEERGSFLAVNIAGFRVYHVEDGEIRWTRRAMVGTPYRQTPVFQGKLAYLEFNPTWTVPPGIHRKDVLPAIKKNPGYLADKHMQVLTPAGEPVDPSGIDWQRYGATAPYIFRQTPGPWNALGQVKFIFPNSHFVFLHDTPHRELFGRSSRAFSSGCIRVQDPMDLAERLLSGVDGWDRNRIESTLEGGETTRVNLDRSSALPVYLLYLTAAVDTDGSVMFLEDIYDRDPRLLTALEQPMHLDIPQR